MPYRYENIDELRTEEGRRYYKNAIYPEITPTEDDLYIITSVGDRYDTLALQFYNDSRLWWVIASANVSKKDSMVVEPGIQLRIPADGQSAKAAFELVNERR